MGSSRWFLDQNQFFLFFKIHYAPRGTTHNLTFLTTQNRPTLMSGDVDRLFLTFLQHFLCSLFYVSTYLLFLLFLTFLNTCSSPDGSLLSSLTCISPVVLTFLPDLYKSCCPYFPPWLVLVLLALTFKHGLH